MAHSRCSVSGTYHYGRENILSNCDRKQWGELLSGVERPEFYSCSTFDFWVSDFIIPESPYLIYKIEVLISAPTSQYAEEINSLYMYKGIINHSHHLRHDPRYHHGSHWTLWSSVRCQNHKSKGHCSKVILAYGSVVRRQEGGSSLQSWGLSQAMNWTKYMKTEAMIHIEAEGPGKQQREPWPWNQAVTYMTLGISLDFFGVCLNSS